MVAGGAFTLSAVRTPIGARGGALAEVSAPDLGANCIREALKRAGIEPGPRAQPGAAAIKAGAPYSAGAVAVRHGEFSPPPDHLDQKPMVCWGW